MTTPATRALTVGFQIERRSDGLHFRATHKSASAWHGPYTEEDLAGTLADYVGEDVAQTLFAEEVVVGTGHLSDRAIPLRAPSHPGRDALRGESTPDDGRDEP